MKRSNVVAAGPCYSSGYRTTRNTPMAETRSSILKNHSLSRVPDVRGRFGPYGGRYVPETLMAALDQLDRAYRPASEDEDSNRNSDSCSQTTSAGRAGSISPSD